MFIKKMMVKSTKRNLSSISQYPLYHIQNETYGYS